MKTVVCVKISNGELNPFDECALEAALEIQNNNITVLCMGPKSAAPTLERLTRLGVDRVILACDNVYAGSDTLATSYVLKKCIEKLEYDAVFCGRQTTDGDTAQVGPCLATLIGIKPITNVMSISVQQNSIDGETRTNTFSENYPVLLTFERINTLRFPSIRSKAHSIEVWDNSVICADTSKCGLNGSPTKVIKVFESKTGRRKCKFITKDEFLPLIEKIKAEPDIQPETENITNTAKLDLAWAIGEKVYGKALQIAKKAELIQQTDPYEIAKLIQEKNPPVVLWNADLDGRKNAPIAAALLKTGLCADCTALETDGKKLYMYRPAKCGNITAKIKCDTLPQMATVRTDTKSGNIIVSAGRGVYEKIDAVKSLAQSLDAEFGASRALVDMGYAPYANQVGLTGKNVNPKIYIAIGISGAVHHTVGIENAKTVIAINPDKGARIFEYADYGIIDEF